MFKVGVAICLIGLLINQAQSFELSKLNRSHNECPDQTNPGVQVADQTLSGGIFEKLHFRIPESGLLKNKITCILITDLKDGHNDPNIKSGGVGSNVVEIDINPFLFETLKYRVQVFVEEPATTTAATTTLKF
ncbi:unnamed protein product [Psylliodes chrysocephalus]|uniref:Uncharacterized protein n=1 Tax=Psylliodes chrysocephalus TaxID=3402493 RepID=A0A9P0CQQ0_9CUCU|nr:unnamed protein product [Psylliodes chrysocephala]